MQICLLILVLGVTTQTISGGSLFNKKVCTTEDDFIGVLGDCYKFRRCGHFGIIYEMSCAQGTKFDYLRKICDFPEKVTCLDDSDITPKTTTKIV